MRVIDLVNQCLQIVFGITFMHWTVELEVQSVVWNASLEKISGCAFCRWITWGALCGYRLNFFCAFWCMSAVMLIFRSCFSLQRNRSTMPMVCTYLRVAWWVLIPGTCISSLKNCEVTVVPLSVSRYFYIWACCVKTCRKALVKQLLSGLQWYGKQVLGEQITIRQYIVVSIESRHLNYKNFLQGAFRLTPGGATSLFFDKA